MYLGKDFRALKKYDLHEKTKNFTKRISEPMSTISEQLY